ncbi:MAG TPA: protein kinase, partial [Polyangiaceae bacterium]|nr:protein kinase [Polyangiaceae bacterium]
GADARFYATGPAAGSMIRNNMVQHASSPLPPGGDPFEGTAYRWLRRVGGGGMGEVHLVQHAALGSEFAAKVLHPRFASNEQLVDRVRVEAQSLGRLEHPNIVRVSSFGRLRDGRPFIIMEPLSGNTLESEVRFRDRLPVIEALRYSLQLASALAAAHELGVIHRDIKPDNLFLHSEHDGSRILKVLDFGVARVVPGISDASPVPLMLPTDTGIVVGTPRYVSPEAARGQRVDHRADLYAAGLVLYFMLAGKGPFDHIKAEQRVLAAHVHDPAPPLASHGIEGLTAEVEALVQRLLAKDPVHRFATARELEAQLATLLQQTVALAEHAVTAPVRRSEPPIVQPATPRMPLSAPGAAPQRLAQPQEQPAARVSSPPAAAVESPTPAPVMAIRANRSFAFITGVFFVVALVVGLASAGAVIVLRGLLGGG